MIAPGQLAPLPVVLPLAAAALLAALRRWLPRAAADGISIGAAALNVLMTALLLRTALQQTSVYWMGGWHPRGSMAIGISFVIDPAGTGLALFAAVLMRLATVFGWRVPDDGEGHLHPLMMVFLAGMSGFALTADIFNLFVFFELMSTAAFALCGLNTRKKHRYKVPSIELVLARLKEDAVESAFIDQPLDQRNLECFCMTVPVRGTLSQHGYLLMA